MKKITPNSQLMALFKSKPQTLIFEGYCSYTSDVDIWQSGNSYALIARIGDVQKTCFYTDDLSFVDEVISQMHGNVEVCGVAPQITQHLGKTFAFEWKTECNLFVWNGQPLPHQNTIETLPMRPEYAQQISAGTPYKAAVSEITECLQRHPSAAIYIGGEPVCWCLCHLEKSLGMLYTLPQHRHKGYALEVMTALCNKIIAGGDVPYAYIITDNVASASLAAKYNLVPVFRADYALIVKP